VSRSIAAAVVVAALCGCNDQVTLAIASDRPVPQAIDAICVGVADLSASGGHFGKRYRLEDKLATLPQTLRLDPGGATRAWAWVRADRGGVPAVRAGKPVDFTSDITLELDRCEVGAAGTPAVVGDPVGPADPRLVVSHGASGQLVVAIGATAEVLDVVGGKLVANPAPELPAGVVVAAIAADLDGDCDDDLVLATPDGPPVFWIRDGTTFTAGATLGTTAVAALASGDVDRDGDIDLVTGTGSNLSLWRNDGSGTYTLDAPALEAGSLVSSVTALALGDVNGDGNPDLLVGQAGDPLRAWLGEPDGTGSFLSNGAVVPPLPLDVARLQLTDLDGDFDPDLVVVVNNAPLHLYVDREGGLEEQTFVLLPSELTATAIAIGGWDPGCEPDAIVAGATETVTLRGQPGGQFESEATAPAASDVVMVDLDDDGNLDAVLATPEGASWLAR
jgi:hypothetical protein